MPVEGRGLSYRRTQKATKDRGIGDEPNNSIQCSEVADGVARKSEGITQPSFPRAVRQGYRRDVLAYAYERCQANGGAAGVDNQTFENIEAYGRERWLDELTQELVLQCSTRQVAHALLGPHVPHVR